MSRLKIVILITIGLLILVSVLLAWSAAKVAASNQQRLADIQQIQTALSLYFKDNGGYPYGNGVPKGIEQYLDRWPTPPAVTGVCPNTQNTYSYTQKNSGDDYAVNFCLGVKTQKLQPGFHILNSKGIQ